MSNVPGCKELVVDGYNGFKCLKKNPDSLADAFEKFIALPYIERIKFGERSRKIVVDNFDENYVIDKYLNIIK